MNKKQYRLSDGRVLFVSMGLSDTHFGTFYRKENGSLAKYNAPGLREMRPSWQAAQKDLDAYAKKKFLPIALQEAPRAPADAPEPEPADIPREIIDAPAGGDTAAEHDAGQVLRIPVGQIVPSPYQPRRRFNEEKLQELADSIRIHGLLQPVTVRRPAGGTGYELIAGERRLRASRLAGLAEIPAILHQVEDQEAAELSLIENLQRDDLDPIEEALGYRALMARGFRQAEIAGRVNRSQPAIANALRLLDLPEDVQEFISTGQLSVSHGKALARYNISPATVSALAAHVVENNWSSKTVETCAIPFSVKGELKQQNLLVELDSYQTNTRFAYRDECANCVNYRHIACDFYCFDPSCWERKNAEIEEQARQRIEELQALAATTGQQVVQATDLPANRENLSYSYNQVAGCREDCEHRVIAVDSRGEECSYCVKPSCLSALKAKATKEKNRAQRDANREKLQRAGARLQAMTLESPEGIQSLVMAVMKHWHGAAADKYRTAGEVAGIPGDVIEQLITNKHQHTETDVIALIAQFDALTILRFSSMMQFQEMVRQAEQGYYSGATRLLDFFNGDVEEQAAKADDSHDDVDSDEDGDVFNWLDGVRRCRLCGCTEHDACVDEHGNACHWVEDDLCSACVGKAFPDECHFCMSQCDAEHQVGCEHRAAILSAYPDGSVVYDADGNISVLQPAGDDEGTGDVPQALMESWMAGQETSGAQLAGDDEPACCMNAPTPGGGCIYIGCSLNSGHDIEPCPHVGICLHPAEQCVVADDFPCPICGLIDCECGADVPAEHSDDYPAGDAGDAS